MSIMLEHPQLDGLGLCGTMNIGFGPNRLKAALDEDHTMVVALGLDETGSVVDEVVIGGPYRKPGTLQLGVQDQILLDIT